MQPGIIINLIVVLINLCFFVKNKRKKNYTTKVVFERNKFLLLTIPLSALFLFKEGLIYLIFLIAIYLFVLLLKPDMQRKIVWKIEFQKVIKRMICCWPLFLAISFFSSLLFGEYSEQEIVSKIRKLRYSSELIKILVMSVILSPIIEEIYFRKILYTSVKKYVGVFWSGIINSLLFSVVHLNLHSFPVLLILGVILTLIYENDGSIISAIVFHSSFNIIMIAFIIF